MTGRIFGVGMKTCKFLDLFLHVGVEAGGKIFVKDHFSLI